MKILEKIRQVGMFAALAQTVPDPGSIPIVPGITLRDLFVSVVRWALMIAAIIAVLYLIFGGFLYLTAGGDAERVTKAKTTIVNAVIGIVVIALAFAIFFAVSNVLRNL